MRYAGVVYKDIGPVCAGKKRTAESGIRYITAETLYISATAAFKIFRQGVQFIDIIAAAEAQIITFGSQLPCYGGAYAPGSPGDYR